MESGKRPLTTSVILVLQPLRQGYTGRVVGIDVDRMVKNKPKLGVRDVAVKVNIEVDPDLFIQPEPEVTIRLEDRRTLIIPTIEPEISVTGDDSPDGDTTDEESTADES